MDDRLDHGEVRIDLGYVNVRRLLERPWSRRECSFRSLSNDRGDRG